MDIPMMNEIFEKMDETTAAAVAQIMEKLSAGGSIKSVQRGIINIKKDVKTATATISSVNTEKAFVLYSGKRLSGVGTVYGSGDESLYFTLELTDATTVMASRLGTTNDWYIPYQVVEFY